MCFSATASLSAAAILAAVGSATVWLCPARRLLPYAAIPLLFALQQLTEGLLWLAWGLAMPALAAAMSQSFSLVAHVLWPAYLPLAVLLIEPQPRRKIVLVSLALTGAGLALYYLLRIVSNPILAVPRAGHIDYGLVYHLGAAGMVLYGAATAGALLASSWPWVRRFGWLAVAALALTLWVYALWLVSVWCFFAALLSALVLAHILAARRGAGQH